MKLAYNPKTGQWEPESKEDVMRQADIEGKTPCDLCWEDARDNGIHAWPVKSKENAIRCECGRIIGWLKN